MKYTIRIIVLFLLTTILSAPQLIAANPVQSLLERIDQGASKKFVIQKQKSNVDFFELDQQGSKVVVRGNTWVNIASGINWYLKSAPSPTPCRSGIGTVGRRRSTGWHSMASICRSLPSVWNASGATLCCRWAIRRRTSMTSSRAPASLLGGR